MKHTRVTMVGSVRVRHCYSQQLVGQHENEFPLVTHLSVVQCSAPVFSESLCNRKGVLPFHKPVGMYGMLINSPNNIILILTWPLKDIMIKFSMGGSTHSMHFCITWLPFWSRMLFNTCPSNSLIISLYNYNNMIAN